MDKIIRNVKTNMHTLNFNVLFSFIVIVIAGHYKEYVMAICIAMIWIIYFLSFIIQLLYIIAFKENDK